MTVSSDATHDTSGWGVLDDLPGHPMMWVLIFSELTAFGLLLGAFAVARAVDPAGFAALYLAGLTPNNPIQPGNQTTVLGTVSNGATGQALAGATPEPELAPIALPRAQPEGGLSSHLGMNLKPVKRGRRKGVKHSSYPEFMAKGAPDDEWVFALIPDPNKGAYRRPVDLIETLHMPEEQIGDATCEQLSMTDYLDRLSGYLQAKAGQDLAGERAGEMATLPPSRVKRPGSDKRS